MKKITVIIIVVCTMLLAVGCSSEDKTDAEKQRLDRISAELNNLETQDILLFKKGGYWVVDLVIKDSVDINKNEYILVSPMVGQHNRVHHQDLKRWVSRIFNYGGMDYRYAAEDIISKMVRARPDSI